MMIQPRALVRTFAPLALCLALVGGCSSSERAQPAYVGQDAALVDPKAYQEAVLVCTYQTLTQYPPKEFKVVPAGEMARGGLFTRESEHQVLRRLAWEYDLEQRRYFDDCMDNQGWRGVPMPAGLLMQRRPR